MDGRANPGERSINIVTENKPKVLAGLGQKGTVAGTRIFPFLVMGSNATGGQSAPTPLVVTETEHGNPCSGSLSIHDSIARTMQTANGLLTPAFSRF